MQFNYRFYHKKQWPKTLDSAVQAACSWSGTNINDEVRGGWKDKKMKRNV